MTPPTADRFPWSENAYRRITDGVAGSVRYACHVSQPQEKGVNAASFIMTPDARPVASGGRLIQGVGYCADAALGAVLLARWGDCFDDRRATTIGEQLFEHAIGTGYLDSDVPIHLYRDAETGEFLNTIEGNPSYLDVGHVAHALANLLRYIRRRDFAPPTQLESASRRFHAFINELERCPDGWIPRRSTHKGDIHPYRRALPGGDGSFPLVEDELAHTSAAGLYVIDFLIAGESLELWDAEEDVRSLSEIFVASGGHFGSVNTDTDDEESFAIALAAVTLLASSRRYSNPHWVEFVLDTCIPRLTRYRITNAPPHLQVDDLYRLADSYAAPCMTENAVVALAFLQAARISRNPHLHQRGIATLTTMADHSQTNTGFLTSEVDWTGERPPEQHLGNSAAGPRFVTHPYRNNLQWVDAAIQLRFPDLLDAELT